HLLWATEPSHPACSSRGEYVASRLIYLGEFVSLIYHCVMQTNNIIINSLTHTHTHTHHTPHIHTHTQTHTHTHTHTTTHTLKHTYTHTLKHTHTHTAQGPSLTCLSSSSSSPPLPPTVSPVSLAPD